LNYYWFIGSETTTPSHYEREFFNIRDSILRGQSQRWAYITVMSTITHGLTPADHTEKETDKMLQELIAQVAKIVEKPGVVNR
jgi:hypothetical protein